MFTPQTLPVSRFEPGEHFTVPPDPGLWERLPDQKGDSGIVRIRKVHSPVTATVPSDFMVQEMDPFTFGS